MVCGPRAAWAPSGAAGPAWVLAVGAQGGPRHRCCSWGQCPASSACGTKGLSEETEGFTPEVILDWRLEGRERAVPLRSHSWELVMKEPREQESWPLSGPDSILLS